MQIRGYTPSDEAFVLRLNAQCVPHVGEMDAGAFANLREWSHRILIAEIEGRASGFLILLEPGTQYPSDNYVWFHTNSELEPNFLYIDRIAVSEIARKLGTGRALYTAAETVAREAGFKNLTAEVNEAPPNPVSQSFHSQLGFVPLASRTSGAGKVVTMLQKTIATL